MAKVLCWGKADSGQLGIGGSDENQCLPVPVTSLPESTIVDISCSDLHTLVAVEDGRLFSCGNNDFGQLGHSGQFTRLEHVEKMKSQKVIKVAAGQSHSLVLTAANEVFTWGDTKYGQLGREGTNEEVTKIPKLVKTLAVYSVIQIACGSNHCLILTSEGLVASWGANNFGQLGCNQTISHRSQPEFINCLKGIPIAQIAAGGNHSFVLSKSGAVFGWGRNSFGQLGVNDERDRPFPTLCKSLRYQKIKYLACGEDHTAALTQNGGVFTFGAGSYGQLGHSSIQNEVLPRQVTELMGSDVTQIACGRRHTLAFVSTSGRLYSFGLGGTGQLGIGTTCNKTSPCRVSGPFLPPVKNNSMAVDVVDKDSVIIKTIVAGGDSSFIISLDLKINKQPDDMRVHSCTNQISSLTPTVIQTICHLQSADSPSVELSEEVIKIFSNASCLNCSFLLSDDKHYGSNSKNHGLDLSEAKENFTRLSETTNVYMIQKICNSLEEMIRCLPSSPPDIEALRLYLLLPLCHVFDEPKYYASLIVPFGHSIISLDKAASKVIDIWWSTFTPAYFNRIVYIYKQCVEFILQLPDTPVLFEADKRKRGLIVSMETLKKLNNVNEQNGQIIPYHQFYISILKNKVNVKVDYVSWVQRSYHKSQELHYCNYPFLFDAAAKSMLLHTDAMMQMQSAIDEVTRFNFNTFLNRMPIDPINPCLVLYVTRENIVHETLQQLSKHTSADLKKPLKVIFKTEDAIDAGGVKKVVFIGEEAVDEGGVRKEFFMLLLREVMDTKYGMFKFYEESGLKWFSPQTFEENDMFHLIGILCGLAIYNFTIINLPFPLALYKKLLKRPVTIEDLNELSPPVARGLQSVLDFDGNVEETFGLTFEVSQELFGESSSVELCPGGSKKVVNIENRKEYVDTYIDYVFNTSVENQYGAFSSGFLKVCGSRVLELFHPLELQAMVIGNENYDFGELEKNTEYKNEYHRYHPTIQYFWEVFYDLSLEDKKKYLKFLTGSDRISIFGMESIKMVIQSTNGGDSYLPVAHTCFNLLDLPKYTSKQKLEHKLLQAIQHTEGFGIV